MVSYPVPSGGVYVLARCSAPERDFLYLRFLGHVITLRTEIGSGMLHHLTLCSRPVSRVRSHYNWCNLSIEGLHLRPLRSDGTHVQDLYSGGKVIRYIYTFGDNTEISLWRQHKTIDRPKVRLVPVV